MLRRAALPGAAILLLAAIETGATPPLLPPPSERGRFDPPLSELPAGATAVTILRLEDRREFGVELLRLLASNDPSTRERAATAAGRIGDPRAVDPLAALLRDRDSSVRAAAAFALGEIEDSSAAIPLALLLRGRSEPEPRVRALSIEGIGKLKAARFASLCVAALSDTSAEVREAAALASWQIQAPAAWSRLAQMAEEPGVETRWKASYALMRMLGAAAPGRTPVAGGVALPDEARRRIREVLLARASDPDYRCRLAAVRGLGSFPDEGARQALRNALSDSDWRVRVEAVRALAPPPREGEESVGRGIDAATLRPVLSDPNPNPRITAIEAMGRPDAVKNATADLRALLARPDLSLREREVASIALGARWRTEIKASSGSRADSLRASITNLADSLTRSESWTLRAAASEILDPANETDLALLERLLHDDPRVAKTAIEPVLKQAAASRPAGRSVLEAIEPDLRWLLSSSDPVLRALAIETAGPILGDSLDAGVKAGWLALLGNQWERSRGDRANDPSLAIMGQLERFASDPAAQAILRAAALYEDAQTRREARRILVAKGLEAAGPEPPIETGRSREEYASILRWAQEDHEVEIVTSRRTVRIRLFTREAPLTCWNFVRLAETGFYDRGRWHRIVPDFVVQDGCPRGDGYGGPGYSIRCEINEKRFVTGAVGMALSGKDTGGSQFFICHSPQPHLDGRYTVFGQVVDGMDVVDGLSQGDPIESIRPVKP